MNEYGTNDVGSEAKYGGKRIRVSGRVASVTMVDGKIVVHFITPMSSFIYFNAYFPMSRKAMVANLQYDQRIIVEGICHGSAYTGIILEDSVVR